MTILSRHYKSQIIHTNHRQPERDLFAHENLVQTTRLLLMGAFKHDEPSLTRQFSFLNERCPTLFSALLPADYVQASREEIEDEADPTVTMNIAGDDKHKDPVVLFRLANKFCRDQLGLPIQGSQLESDFKNRVRMAYETDYKKNIIVLASQVIKWWKKVSFTDRYVS